MVSEIEELEQRLANLKSEKQAKADAAKKVLKDAKSEEQKIKQAEKEAKAELEAKLKEQEKEAKMKAIQQAEEEAKQQEKLVSRSELHLFSIEEQRQLSPEKVRELSYGDLGEPDSKDTVFCSHCSVYLRGKTPEHEAAIAKHVKKKHGG